MATATLTRSAGSRRVRIAGKILFSLIILFGAAIGVTAGWFHHAAIVSLPQVDGELHVAGLAAPVEVLRDLHGVPHITAANLPDLFFAQGFITAQDRLWQMDVNRRFGRGELAEIFGSRLVPIDKRQRILQLARVAENSVQLLPALERGHLEAYARGVNALIESRGGNLPMEFRILGYTPRPWTLADSMMIGVNISQSLSTEYDVEHAREKIEQKMPPEMAADLYPTTSWRDRPPSALTRTAPPATQPLPAGTDAGAEETRKQTRLLEDLGVQLPCESCTLGSNNWVVSGSHTVSGKPLLSNDMHLQHSIPNVWYEVHLKAGDFDVAGVSFPGLPFVIAGHNQRVAWGFTNLGPDVQDMFIETFNGAGEYQTPKGWLRPVRRQEVIKVKRGADVTVETVVTRHGPIISSLFPGETRQLALQWTIYDPPAMALKFFQIDQAKDWKQFRQAVSQFGGASQNAVYADADGHIGYQATGFIPVRASGDGAIPVPGNDDAHEWTGYVPFEKLPSIYDPAGGILATANGRITPDNYPLMLANQWGSPFRVERIYKVLESNRKFSASDMLALQMDIYSEFDRLTADRLVYAIDHAPQAEPRVRQAADLMRGWDGRVTTDAVAPTIAVTARKKLWQMLLEPRLGAGWIDYQWFGSSVAMEKILRTKPQRWLPAGTSDFDTLLTAAVAAAVADKQMPRDLADWRWGANYPMTLQHPVFGTVPWLSRFSGPGTVSQSGNGSLTVKAAGRSFGASERATYDLADLDASTLNIVTGQSGQIFSPHYMDQWPEWYNGTTMQLPYSDGAVKKNAAHTLRLLP